MKKSSENDDNKKHHELPFVDEMNELITKEKHLLQLKIIEQKREAEEWKAKYMSVVTKVGDSANKTGDYRAMEFIGDVDSADNDMDEDLNTQFKKKIIDATQEGISQLLNDLQHKWVLDLSHHYSETG